MVYFLFVLARKSKFTIFGIYLSLFIVPIIFDILMRDGFGDTMMMLVCVLC